MRPSTRSIIADLAISNFQTDGHPNVNQRDRNELLRYLTHVVVNDVTLAHHRDLLKTWKVKRPQLPTDTVNTIVNIGLDHLTNNELATLALDGVALDSLYQDVDQRTPQAWTPAINQEGLKTVSVPDDQDDQDD